MAIRDLIPRKERRLDVSVSSGQEDDAFFDLRDQVNRMFDDFMDQFFGLSRFTDSPTWMGSFSPRLEVSETKDNIIISAELPGIEPEAIDISLDRDTLTIRGEKRADKEEKGRRFMHIERSYGAFQRTIPLPSQVDEDRVDASFKHGVLKITLPKTRPAHAHGKQFKIRSG